jgi:hypothetical protein
MRNKNIANSVQAVFWLAAQDQKGIGIIKYKMTVRLTEAELARNIRAILARVRDETCATSRCLQI